MTPRRPRIAVLGYLHEVNALAEPVTLGHGIESSRTPGGLAATWDVGPALRRLDELGEVDVVELPVWEFGASGPLLGDDFRVVLREAADALDAALADGPIDGVVMMGHGAGRTTDDFDPDATYLRMIRHHVGEAPVVAVLDFHANLSDAMCDLLDVVVGYRTNPHVDIAACAVEAAEHVHRLVTTGEHTVRAHCKLPMVLPQIAQLTAPEEPLGEVRAAADVACTGPIRNVSLFGGFSLGDVPDAGVSLCVTADESAADAAAALAATLAEQAWALRPRYRIHAVPLAESVAIALDAAARRRSPVILADVADNPGGGAPGNSVFVLEALLDAGVDGVVFGLQCDPGVVAAAQAAGVGATVTVTFNEGSRAPLARPLTVQAEVLSLVVGEFVSTRGVYAGATRRPGPSCALRIGGVRVGVCSWKVQCSDPAVLEHVGLSPASARVVVVKSRGHFRAGFDLLFPPDAIVEVGAPGVATCELATVDWQHLPRPVFPLDDIADWHPVVTLHRTERGTVDA